MKKLLDAKVVSSPCLELGVGYGGATARELVQSAGIAYFGTDLEVAPGVDIRADFECSYDLLRTAFSKIGSIGTIILLNVLEHTFEPIRVLDNVFMLLKPGGTAIIVAPSVWPLHAYPRDFWRLNPDFYVEYGSRRGLRLMSHHCEFIGRESLCDARDSDGNFRLPTPSAHKWGSLVSRSIHRLFNTFGRGMAFPSHVALGTVFQKPEANLET